MELRRLGGITPARVPVSGARGSATAKETCWESGSRFGLDGSARPLVASRERDGEPIVLISSTARCSTQDQQQPMAMIRWVPRQ
jgi:hypothetical protein